MPAQCTVSNYYHLKSANFRGNQNSYERKFIRNYFPFRPFTTADLTMTKNQTFVTDVRNSSMKFQLLFFFQF